MKERLSVAFVAERRIPPAPPPAKTGGVVGWLRENLFSGIFNTVATLLSFAFVAYVLASVVPWLFLDSVWNASSLQECRKIDDGACLAVINERFLQFVFGFYPDGLRWRPVLAFALMFIAIWPALFASAPRKLLIFTGLYPLLAYWLIWGGSFWGPVGVLAGPVLGWACVRWLPGLMRGWLDERLVFLAAVGVGLLATVLWWLFGVTVFDDTLSAVLAVDLDSVESARLGGFLLSTIIGVSGIVGSLPVGIVLALGRQSNLLIIKGCCVGFIEFIRGVPLITLLFVAWLLLAYFLPPGTEFDLILRVVIMVTAFASAYMAEVIRGGLAALPVGQYEAADSLGLDYWKSMQLIILPQALKVSIPGIVNTFIGLFKDTTLVIVIGLLDPVGLLQPIRADQNWNGIVWELYGFIALFFFIFCFAMSRYSMHLERNLDVGHR